MSVKFVAFALLAATGVVLFASEPAVSRGGGGGARFAPAAARIMVPPRPFFRPSLRSEFAHSGPARAFRHTRPLIPPSARGYATITPARPFATTGASRPFATTGASRPFATTTLERPFAHLVRRHHRIYHAGWSFPVTYGGDGYPGYYIGTPYDPGEAFPVYGPAPAEDQVDPVDPPARRAPIMSRTVNATPGEACRSEQVTVPASDGERTITVVRC